jgi:hypothetical protein
VPPPPREHAALRSHSPAHTRRRAGGRGDTSFEVCTSISVRSRVKTARVARVCRPKRAQMSAWHVWAAMRQLAEAVAHLARRGTAGALGCGRRRRRHAARRLPGHGARLAAAEQASQAVPGPSPAHKPRAVRRPRGSRRAAYLPMSCSLAVGEPSSSSEGTCSAARERDASPPRSRRHRPCRGRATRELFTVIL